MIHLIKFFILISSILTYSGPIELPEKTPSEVHLLVKTYDQMPNNKTKKQILLAFQNLQKVLGDLNQDTEFLLIKNEIYKTLMEYPIRFPSDQKNNEDPLLSFPSLFKNKKDEFSPLAQWVCHAILKEWESIPTIPVDHPTLTSKLKIKSKALRAWQKTLKGKKVTEINNYFNNVLVEVMANLNLRLSLFSKYSLD